MKLAFKLWIESRLEEKKVREKLLERLGFNKSAMDDSSVQTTKIKSMEKKILKSLDSIGLNSEKLDLLKNFVKNNPNANLQDIINQISSKDIEDQELKSNIPGEEAEIPEDDGFSQEISSEDDKMLNNPPKQGNMQLPF